jgi:VanZ family protein
MPSATHCRSCSILRWLSLAAWAAGILWLSLTPSPPELSGDLLGWDKAQHAAAYCLLTWLAGRALELHLHPRQRAWLVAALLAIAYGGTIECAQGLLTEVRMADARDLLANALGAGVVWAWARCRLREERP